MSKALLVIDVQQSFRHQPYFDERELPRFRERLLALVAGFKARGWPVVNIFHLEEGGPFDPANGFVRPLDDMAIDGEVRFDKRVHNAFTGTGLQAWLDDRGFRELTVSGIRTEQCCETTTRVASDLGYRVNFVTEATLSFPMTNPRTREIVPPEAIYTHTEMVLERRFARIVTVDEALA